LKMVRPPDLEYINANLSDKLELGVLANVADVSAYHFARAFKQSTGESPAPVCAPQADRKSKRISGSFTITFNRSQRAHWLCRSKPFQVGLRRIHAMGYASTGMKEILDEADVPNGSFYHYFPAKKLSSKRY
jgi:AraC-like DNA-binding protein